MVLLTCPRAGMACLVMSRNNESKEVQDILAKRLQHQISQQRQKESMEKHIHDTYEKQAERLVQEAEAMKRQIDRIENDARLKKERIFRKALLDLYLDSKPPLRSERATARPYEFKKDLLEADVREDFRAAMEEGAPYMAYHGYLILMIVLFIFIR